ncbi:MAG: 3'(2'),5'-bisphosphate nucleotidase CysQ [Acidobacteria bacterium]|nr:3'(2'),5'-bisphosphate nucleotidase CysQ [Acidobacteriota bacterium]
MNPAARGEDLRRIAEALQSAASVLRGFQPGRTAVEYKGEREIVTAADREVNRQLLKLLPRGDEGWLSEEGPDDLQRTSKRRVWVVDPLDGTKEFVAGIPEWCVSIGLVEEGQAVAGGILNPVTGEVFLGSAETGVLVNGRPASDRRRHELSEMVVLASRSEMGRGEWDRFQGVPFQVRPLGSVAYKLAYVAAGLADATWTFVPKHEWDVAAGVALVKAAGGIVKKPDGQELVFNSSSPLLDGLMAFSAGSARVLLPYLKGRRPEAED